MVLAAFVSCSVLISSTSTAEGEQFSTAIRITSCCLAGVSQGSHRAAPIDACGMSDAPAISQVLSTTATMRPSLSSRSLAKSRSTVVFPAFGGPSSSTDASAPRNGGGSMR